MQSFIEEWLGENRPKQYCALIDSRSLLQSTFDRIMPAVDPERVITIIGPGQRRFLEEAISADDHVNLIEQPDSRGTASAVYTALAHVRLHDPDAIVLLAPSDHHVYPEDTFVEHLERAFEFVEENPQAVVCLGALPSYPETEYGWIEPESHWGGGLPTPLSILPVAHFVEKPSLHVAENLLETGSLWNTLVVVGSAGALWNLGWRTAPKMMSRLDLYLAILQSVRKGLLPEAYAELALRQTYMLISPLDLSRGVLERAAESLYVLPMAGVDWNDLGHPGRLMESRRWVGRTAAVPSGLDGVPHTFRTETAPAIRVG